MSCSNIMQCFMQQSFMPPGQGGLILIFGGVAMLVFALLLIMVSPSRMPAGSHASSGLVGCAMAAAYSKAQAPANLNKWHKTIRKRVRRMGLQRIRFRLAEKRLCIMILDRCPSCVLARRNCDKEVRRLSRAARWRGRSARVEELHCGLGGSKSCAFVIEMRR